MELLKAWELTAAAGQIAGIVYDESLDVYRVSKALPIVTRTLGRTLNLNDSPVAETIAMSTRRLLEVGRPVAGLAATADGILRVRKFRLGTEFVASHIERLSACGWLCYAKPLWPGVPDRKLQALRHCISRGARDAPIGYSALAARLDVSTKTARRYVRDLVDWGLLDTAPGPRGTFVESAPQLLLPTWKPSGG